ncbi:cellulase family glycosylhydrolase [Corynebacterium sp. A21]|uniref:cellulase family glycosylhydrolase n=1 Tax=Corynebacterium sp. A21 TaxID=3457318 RepID=UPI003FD06DB9
MAEPDSRPVGDSDPADLSRHRRNWDDGGQGDSSGREGQELPGRNWFGWCVAVLAVLVSIALVCVILSLSRRSGEEVEVVMPEVSAGGCSELGMAGPAQWDWMGEDEFQVMVGEQVTLGAKWIRISASWHEIERQQGSYYWDQLDQRVNAAVDAGLTPLLLLHTLPDWVEGFGVVDSGAAQHYGEFAGAVAQHYGDRVTAYEIWNEPNIERFWPNPDPVAYAEWLAVASQNIEAVDPGAEIIAGGLAPASNVEGISYSGYTFLERLYELEALNYVTAVAVHPYSYPERPSGMARWNTFRQLGQIKELLRENGDGGKKIWLTEYGAPTSGEGGVGEREQATMVSEALRLAWIDPTLGPIFIYTMYDLDFGEDDRESHFGLMYGPGDPKVAFTALREVAVECGAGAAG